MKALSNPAAQWLPAMNLDSSNKIQHIPFCSVSWSSSGYFTHCSGSNALSQPPNSSFLHIHSYIPHTSSCHITCLCCHRTWEQPTSTCILYRQPDSSKRDCPCPRELLMENAHGKGHGRRQECAQRQPAALPTDAKSLLVFFF